MAYVIKKTVWPIRDGSYLYLPFKPIRDNLIKLLK